MQNDAPARNRWRHCRQQTGLNDGMIVKGLVTALLHRHCGTISKYVIDLCVFVIFAKIFLIHL